MLKKKVKNQKRQLIAFNNAAKPGQDNEESDDLDKEEGISKHSDMKQQGKFKLFKKVWQGTPQYTDYGELVDSCIIVAEICTIKVGIVEEAT